MYELNLQNRKTLIMQAAAWKPCRYYWITFTLTTLSSEYSSLLYQTDHLNLCINNKLLIRLVNLFIFAFPQEPSASYRKFWRKLRRLIPQPYTRTTWWLYCTNPLMTSKVFKLQPVTTRWQTVTCFWMVVKLHFLFFF